MFAKNALWPLSEMLMLRVACTLTESVTTNSGVQVPCPPISELLMFPVLSFRDIPSGNGEKLELVFTEKV